MQIRIGHRIRIGCSTFHTGKDSWLSSWARLFPLPIWRGEGRVRIPRKKISRREPLNPWVDSSECQSGAEAARTPDADARYGATTAARSVWSAGGFSAAFPALDGTSALRFMGRDGLRGVFICMVD